MKKRKVVLIMLVLILLTPLWSFLVWLNQTPISSNILIFDKTVHTKQRNEHRSFCWVLNYHYFVNQDSLRYDSDENYLGFFPVDPVKEKTYTIKDLDSCTTDEINKFADTLDMFYYADSYGVYRNEWFHDTLETEHSPLLYGGMKPKELELLRKMKSQNKLIITEFNTIASPTNSKIKKEFEETFGMKWTLWTGRYFEILDTAVNKELPEWLINSYLEQHDSVWPFTKSGIALIHNGGRVEILESGTHLKVDVPYIYTKKEEQERFNLVDSVHYPFWFDIIEPDSSKNIISTYKIHTNARGDSILSEINVPKIFPAVIEQKETHKFYYFSGDFADNPINDYTSYFKGITLIDNLVYETNISSRHEFFWTFYEPLISEILNEYYEIDSSK